MLRLDVSQTLAKAITPSVGIPDQEMTGLATGMRRYVQDWLKEREQGQHAWSMAPYDKVALQRVKEEVLAAKAERFTTVVWIGIGGSALGPKVIQEVFEGPEKPQFLLLDTVDPAILAMEFSLIEWKKTLLVVASKSGGTLESMSVFFACYEQMKAALRDRAKEHVIAITDPYEGTLRNFCLEEAIRMLPLHPEIGGRFSIFTPVGLLSLALLDGNVDDFVRGAKEMDTLCQATNPADNPAALLASVQYLLNTKRNCLLRVLMPYTQRLQSIGRWDQQLIAESLGKVETDNPIPVAAVGTQDQHSLLQQWMAGPRKQWHLFIRTEEKPRLTLPEGIASPLTYLSGKSFSQILDACYWGTAQALTAAKRPHATITLPRLDALHLGQLFFLLLTEVVLLGKLYRIDPYGQPAVELGKQLTKEILSKGKSKE